MKKLDHLLAAIGGSLQSVVLLVIRLYWGWSFFTTGRGKLMHLDKISAYFGSLHVPAPHVSAVLCGTTETVGGLLLLLGLWSRLVTVPLMFTMVIAYLTAESDALHAIFSDPDKFTGALPFLFFYACLIVFVFGPGKVSLDALRDRKSASS